MVLHKPGHSLHCLKEAAFLEDGPPPRAMENIPTTEMFREDVSAYAIKLRHLQNSLAEGYMRDGKAN